MLVGNSSFFQQLKLLKRGIISLCFLSVLFPVTTFFIVNRGKENDSFEKKEVFTKPLVVESKPFPKEIFSLSPSFEGFYEEDLQKDLLFLGGDTRPDCINEGPRVLMSLRGSVQRQELQLQKKVYLTYKKGRLDFAKHPTALWIKPIELEQGHVSFEALFFHEEEGKEPFKKKIRSKKQTVLLDLEELPSHKIPFYDLLKQAHILGPDLFFSSYAGDDYAHLKQAHRLFLGKKEVLFIKEGDLLFFDGMRWKEVTLSSETQSAPLAKVLKVAGSTVHIKVWDSSGIYAKTLFLEEIPQAALSYKGEDLFSKLRQRNAQQVSCKIGKQTLFLRKGDWVLKTGSHYRVLKTWEEIEKYLSYQLEGELFVFNQIEKKQGSTMFKGTLFDKMRTQRQDVSVAMSLEKKTLPKRKETPIKQQEPQEEVEDDAAFFDEEDEELLKLAPVGQ